MFTGLTKATGTVRSLTASSEESLLTVETVPLGETEAMTRPFARWRWSIFSGGLTVEMLAERTSSRSRSSR